MTVNRVEAAVGLVRAWIEERFPDAPYRYLGPTFDERIHRWRIDVGDGIHLGCTPQTMEDESFLRQRLYELDSQGYLAKMDGEMWLELTTVGVVVKNAATWPR